MNRSATPVPAVSVVMGCRDGADQLDETVRSVLTQDLGDFELVVVDDGSADARVADRLRAWAGGDSRCRVVRQTHAGLTQALVRGCAEARGSLIARIDNGDIMLPGRLRLQKAALDRQSGVVFVSCWSEVCGPRWEPLDVVRGIPTPEGGVDLVPVVIGPNLIGGPTHHATVMFRRCAYEAAGGYRAAFYFGQDWDLWYRLAERGRFYIVPEVLCRTRVFPDSLSGRNKHGQEAIGRQSLAAFNARRRGEGEGPALAAAARIRPGVGRARNPLRVGTGWYFIGAMLLRRGDARCRRYFRGALARNPFHLRAALGWMRSLALGAGGLVDAGDNGRSGGGPATAA